MIHRKETKKNNVVEYLEIPESQRYVPNQTPPDGEWDSRIILSGTPNLPSGSKKVHRWFLKNYAHENEAMIFKQGYQFGFEDGSEEMEHRLVRGEYTKHGEKWYNAEYDRGYDQARQKVRIKYALKALTDVAILMCTCTVLGYVLRMIFNPI